MGKLVGVEPRPQDNGSHTFTVETESGEFLDVTISEDQAVDLVRVLQAGFLERREKMGPVPHYPAPVPTRIYFGHGPDGGSALLVDTVETGTVAYPLSPQRLEELRVAVSNLTAKHSQARH